jgi:drug/metabolite transporter (DMT)-like permease
MFPLVMVVDHPWTLSPDLAAVGAISGLVLLSTVLACLLYFGVLRSAGATNLLLVTLLMPVSAHILGAVFLDERLYATSVAGMAFIVFGLGIIDGRMLRWLRGVRASDSAPFEARDAEEK